MITTFAMCSLDFDEDYIPHYLNHYNKQGIDRHILILHSKKSVDESLFKKKYSDNNISVFFNYGVWNSVVMQNAKHSLLKKLDIGIDDWIINSDIDEHAEPKHVSLRSKISEMTANGENCCIGRMVDRITENGSFSKILPDIPLSQQFPLSSDIGRKLLRCHTRKIPISRGDLTISGGNHLVIPDHKKKAVYNNEILTVNHYKWTDRIKDKLEEEFALTNLFLTGRNRLGSYILLMKEEILINLNNELYLPNIKP